MKIFFSFVRFKSLLRIYTSQDAEVMVPKIPQRI